MQVVCLLASNHNKFSFVFDCCFTAIDICRLPWPWDVRLLKRRQYREDLGNSPSWRPKLPVFPSFPCSPAPFEPSFCPQSLLGSIHLFCWAFCVVRTVKSSSNLVIMPKVATCTPQPSSVSKSHSLMWSKPQHHDSASPNLGSGNCHFSPRSLSCWDGNSYIHDGHRSVARWNIFMYRIDSGWALVEDD